MVVVSLLKHLFNGMFHFETYMDICREMVCKCQYIHIMDFTCQHLSIMNFRKYPFEERKRSMLI